MELSLKDRIHDLLDIGKYDEVYDILNESVSLAKFLDILRSYGGDNFSTLEYRLFLTKILSDIAKNTDIDELTKYIIKTSKILRKLGPFISESTVDILTYFIFQFISSHNIEEITYENLKIIRVFLIKWGTSTIVEQYVDVYMRKYNNALEEYSHVEIYDMGRKWQSLLQEDV